MSSDSEWKNDCQEMTAVVTRATPTRLSQCRVSENQEGHLIGESMQVRQQGKG